MRKILIVGAGQAGLQLALSLLQHEYDVTVMTARTAGEVATGRAVSVNMITGDQLALERAYGLDLWDGQAPPIRGSHLFSPEVGPWPGYDWTGYYREPAQSVDERVKMSVWLDLFERMGGRVVIHPVTVSDLDHLTRMYDLTVVAAGQSGLAEMFPADHDRRGREGLVESVTAIAYVTEVEGDPAAELSVGGWMPGIGQLISIPSLSLNGPCRLLYIGGPTAGAMGSWPERMTPRKQLDLMLDAVEDHLPDLYEVYKDVQLVDRRSVTMDYSVPLVRDPVAVLPSGRRVLGIGDTVVVTMPGFAQNANNECRSADVYLRAILEHEDRPFDEDFMRAAFAGFEEFSRPFCGDLVRLMSTVPPHLYEVYKTANTCQAVADRFVEGFNDPADMMGWLGDEKATRAYLAEAAGG
ncbi:styrene monooxygenase/indole monooxygenase family protein [Actinorugispora endophytica]|uniref:2-polyprenyl-6-methoxyphenol hydroxylase-like FAD-dependent oxidoreductase n=1 Tax=Actinorugispora endophytica TaxID=1605990 RepID=A0A4R6V8L7_9ACTN|nr:styrene monooxygenase/indole monooxygenase family protein [Actinorugispora endophytica]TDQ55516.1 2-polyprenyl-6-methoxyphenol hydroxylase-like FAD-dependent oxidoreductase [Actinorugispora endophytica]